MVKLFGAATRGNRKLSALAVALCLGSGAALASAATPAAAATTVTFDFVGKCADCSGYGLGQLTLTNFTPGQKITAANFVSFSYTSNMIDLSISASQLTALAGLLDPSNMTDAHVMVGGDGMTFESSGTGFWAVASAGEGGAGPGGAAGGGGGGGGGGGSAGADAPPQPPTSFFDGADFDTINSSFTVDDFGPSFDFRQVDSVPEPASWALMIGGFAGVGGLLRSRHRSALSIETA